MVQELCQVYYQFSLIILQKKLIKLKSKIVNFLVNTKFKNNLPKRKCLSCNKNYSNKTDDKN